MGRGVHWPLLKIRRDFHWCRCGDRTFGDLSVLRFKPGDEMIERITSAFDWVYELPIESQCHFAIGLSFFGFVVAAAVRETVKHSGVRYLARAIGAGSFFAVAAFAHHVAHENEKLSYELMVKRGEKATDIASERYLTVTTKSGNTFEFGVSKHGVRNRAAAIGRSSSKPIAGGSNPEPNSIGFTASRLGSSSGTSTVLNGFDGARELSHWWRRVWADADEDDAGTAGRFEASGHFQGESF